MLATLVATVGHGSTALWYLTRATGLVSLILLSATVVLGTVASVGWTTDRWPRFLSQSVHRNLSLFCLALIGVHIVTTVGDGYVPIGLADAVIPFRSPYRPIWVGLGAWRSTCCSPSRSPAHSAAASGWPPGAGSHWLAYACWPIAAVHGLGSGTDARLPGATLVFVVCIGSVAAAVAWRLAVGRARSVTWRVGGAIGTAAVLLVIAAFATAGPLRPGWSHRAGTSSALLAQLSGTKTASLSGATATTAPPTSTPVRSGIPATPFSTSVSGTVTQSAPDAHSQSVVTLAMQLANTSAPLKVTIIGVAENGGVAMRRSAVSFGSSTGQVTALEGSDIGAVVSGPSGSINLTMNLALDPAAGTLTGQVSGSTAQ